MKPSEIILSKEQELLIEKLGNLNEKTGLQPAAARILALLLVTDSMELTFEQIHETLKISKSAASNAIHLLLTTNKLDYVTKLGDRRRYFHCKLIFWQDHFKQSLDQLRGYASILEEVLQHRTAETVVYNNQLKEIIDFIQFLDIELQLVYDKWQKSRV
ncbi:MAG: hypothetical protein Q8M08_09095 [Bacteroidales bacterium]|nr:hypothetical protein [Bacteroidales bacterium]